MKVHNTRSPKQWEIISKHIDFKDKTVLDLGCGCGDILLRCKEAGAKTMYGVDKDESLVARLGDIISQQRPIDDGILGPRSCLAAYDFDASMPWNKNFDIAFCFSVLPYLEYPLITLRLIRERSQIALIECQYAGDGPGLTTIKNDRDMLAYLRLAGWQSIEAIGKTLVEDRDKYRTIWMCQ